MVDRRILQESTIAKTNINTYLIKYSVNIDGDKTKVYKIMKKYDYG